MSASICSRRKSLPVIGSIRVLLAAMARSSRRLRRGRCMKRRKRMGMYRAPANVSRGTIEATVAPRAHVVVETTPVQAHDPMPSAFESTPEKFVAFVNRRAKERDAGSARTLAGDRS
jgi:hypothetical protein